MEVAAGLEPAKTGFADQRFDVTQSHFQAGVVRGAGSPSSPTEGLKISVFPGKRHQTRHLDFAFLGC